MSVLHWKVTITTRGSLIWRDDGGGWDQALYLEVVNVLADVHPEGGGDGVYPKDVDVRRAAGAEVDAVQVDEDLLEGLEAKLRPALGEPASLMTRRMKHRQHQAAHQHPYQFCVVLMVQRGPVDIAADDDAYLVGAEVRALIPCHLCTLGVHQEAPSL